MLINFLDHKSGWMIDGFFECNVGATGVDQLPGPQIWLVD
jgi:hypothetical protein